MKRRISYSVVFVMLVAMGSFFLLPAAGAEEVAVFPLNSMDGVITQDGVALDPGVSSDGKGSLRIDAAGPTKVRLFEVTGLDFDNARVIYQARDSHQGCQGGGVPGNVAAFPRQRRIFFSRFAGRSFRHERVGLRSKRRSF